MAQKSVRKRPGPEEIPQLKAIGLTCVNTAGSGNCLFHALSDQLYGDQTQHARLRADTVDYMRQNPEAFKRFVTANPGGGIRRNPKRKNAGTLSSRFDPTPPTEADINTAFALSLDIMARGGTYGDNAEIIAFSRCFRVDIRIWHAASEAFYNVDCDIGANESPQTLYIVYHTYEHYSSIRNIEGPLTGLPQIKFKAISPEAQRQLQRELAEGPEIQEWMVKLAMASLPYEANRGMVRQTLRQCRGNINLTVDFLLPDTSPETSERSSSLEREPDSDDGSERKPLKKQYRRISRPHPLRNNNLPVRPKQNGGMSSPDPRHLAVALKKVDRQKTAFDPEETEEEDWKEDGPYHDSESASVSTSASDYSPSELSQQTRQQGRSASVPRFRLSQPRRPELDPDLDIKEISSSTSEQSTTLDSLGSSLPNASLSFSPLHHHSRHYQFHPATATAAAVKNNTSPSPLSSKEQLLQYPHHRMIAKPRRRRRLVNGTERAADLAKKSARNQHLANHATANSQQENTPFLGIKAIRI